MRAWQRVEYWFRIIRSDDKTFVNTLIVRP